MTLGVGVGVGLGRRTTETCCELTVDSAGLPRLLHATINTAQTRTRALQTCRFTMPTAREGGNTAQT